MLLPSFSRADVAEIGKFANALQRKTAYGPVPSHLQIGGHAVPIRATRSDGQTTGCLEERALRALYSPTEKDIQLYCAGVTLSASDAAREHIVAVVGHEALHAIQDAHFSKGEIASASELAGKADASPDAYEAYVSCAVELPAHAVMIALALRNDAPTNFETAAQSTHMYAYFAERLDGAANGATALAALTEAAAEMHQRFAPEEE